MEFCNFAKILCSVKKREELAIIKAGVFNTGLPQSGKNIWKM